MNMDITSRPPETVLPSPDPVVLERINEAGANLPALSAIVADNPESLFAWAALGEVSEGAGATTEFGVRAYSAFRVGYHRGLDSLRKNGWRGSGYVRWEHDSNRGFLRCLSGLGRMAALIGEASEHDRCEEFLRMLDPDWSSIDQQ